MLLVAGAGFLPGASAHLFEAPKKPYFDGSTWSNGNRVDPVTIVFQGNGSYYSKGVVEAHLRYSYGLAGMNFADWDCNTATQRMIWFDRNPTPKGGNSKSDAQDLDMSTSTVCGDQIHTRMWDDYEHTTQFPGHASDTFYMGSVHREERVCEGDIGGNVGVMECGHSRRGTFEKEAHQMALLSARTSRYWCTDLKWKQVPGSQGPQGTRDYSDGYLTKVTYTPYGDC